MFPPYCYFIFKVSLEKCMLTFNDEKEQEILSENLRVEHYCIEIIGDI